MGLPRQGLGISKHRGLRCCGIVAPRARNIQNGRKLRATKWRGVRRCGHCEELQATRQSPCHRGPPSTEGSGAVGLPRQGLAISRIGGPCDPRSAAVLGKRVDIARSFRRRGNPPATGAPRAARPPPEPPPATGAVLQSGSILCILREASWKGPLTHHLAPIPAAGFAPRKS